MKRHERSADEVLVLAAGGSGGTGWVTTATFTAHTSDPGAHHDAATAGDGITLSVQQINVDGTVVRATRTITAGNGLTGGGALSTDLTLNVGTGDGISVAADAIAVDGTVVRTTRQIIAGNGLTGGGTLAADRTLTLDTPGTLSTSSGNTAVGNHTHLITASSTPGAATSLLKTDTGGDLTLQSLTVTTDLTVSGDISIGGGVGSHLIPTLTDTYDIGSSTMLWRHGWLSELDTILFAENTITLLGGWFVVSKDAGTVAEDLTAVQTTVDFGKTMTPSDFVLFRASLAMEYMQVGSLVGGTTYNVTRNVDGGGANAWAQGSPFMVLGNTGDGRIELNAYDSPRIQILEQGSAYNAQTEKMRMGDLNGNWGYTGETYGLALGEYTASMGNMTWDATNGLRLRTYTETMIQLDNAGNASIEGALTLGSNGGIYQGTGTFASPTTGLKIWNNAGTGNISLYDAANLGVNITDNGLALSNDEITVPITDSNEYNDAAPDGVSSLQLKHTSQSIVGGFVQGYHADFSFPTGWDGLVNTDAYDEETVRIDIGTGPDKSGTYITLQRLIASSGPGAAQYARKNEIFYTASQHTFTGSASISGSVNITGSTLVQGNLDCYADIEAADHVAARTGGMVIGSLSTDGVDDQLRLYATGTLRGQLSADSSWFRINQDVATPVYTPRLLRADGGVASGSVTPGSGNIGYTGSLMARRSSVNYTVQGMKYLATPVKLKENVTVSASGFVTLTGIPTEATAVLVYLSQKTATSARVVAAGPSSTYVPIVTRMKTTTITEDEMGVSPVSSNQIYLYVDGSASSVYLYIYGYAI